MILAAALLSLVAAKYVLAQEPLTGLFGEIVTISPTSGNAVTVTLSTKDGRKDMAVDQDTVLVIPGNDSPSISDLETGQYIAATMRTVAGQPVAVKALVKPQEPVESIHIVGVVTGKEGNQIMLVDKNGESVSVILPVGFADVEEGTTVTAVVRRDPATQDLSVQDLRTASQEIDRLGKLLEDAQGDPRTWVLKNLETALDAATSRHLSLLSDVAKNASPNVQSTLTQVLQIQQQQYQQTASSLNLPPPAIQITGVIWFISAEDRSVTVRLYPLENGEAINLITDADTKIVWEGQPTTFDQLSRRPANETTGLTVKVQYEVGTFKTRSIEIVKRELDPTLLSELIGEVGKGEAEGRVIQKNTTTTPQTVVISLTAGGTLTLNVTSDTKVFVADQEAQLLQLPLNAKVNVRYDAGTQNAIEITVVIDRPNEAFFSGIVTELVRKARSIMVTNTEGVRLALSIADDAAIFRDGNRVPIQEVQLGDLVRSTSRYNTGTNEIIALTLQSPTSLPFTGTIVGLQSAPASTGTGAINNYVTVAASGNGLGLLTIRVSGTTDVVRDGAAASFASIRVGDRVVEGAYHLTVLYDQMTKEGARLKLQSAQTLKTQGTIVSINSDAGTFIVQPPTGETVTLKFTPSTEGEKDGTPDLFIGRLETGDNVVEAMYNATTGEVSRLVVLSSNTLTTRGVIKSISLSPRRVTVAVARQEVALTITDTTEIVKGGQKVLLSRLSPGDVVIAAYYNLDGTAIRIDTRSPNVVTATTRASVEVRIGD